MHKKIVSIIFCFIIFIGCFDIIYASRKEIIQAMYTLFENKRIDIFFQSLDDNLNFDSNTTNNFKWIYDKTQIVLGKKEIDNFTYYKNDDTGGLMLITDSSLKSSIAENQDKVKKLYEILKKDDIPFFYIHLPEEMKGDYKENLKNIDYGNEISDEFLEGLEPVPYIDLRKNESIYNMSENFYRTDHHWNIDTCFEAVKITINELNNRYNMDLDPTNQYSNLNNYSTIIKEKSFCGSKGVNTNSNYTEKEDFKLFIPNYDTSFEYNYYIPNGDLKLSTKGSFLEALIDNEILESETYINKYNSFLYSANCESIIINKKSENNKKLLIISASWGRAFTPYISQYFYETRYIDPQLGRFNKNVKEYIKDYKPDVILMIYKTIPNVAEVN